MTHHHTKPSRLVINLPKRYCANVACRREIAPTNRYNTCCYACKLAVDRMLAEVEAADKQTEGAQPF